MDIKRAVQQEKWGIIEAESCFKSQLYAGFFTNEVGVSQNLFCV